MDSCCLWTVIRNIDISCHKYAHATFQLEGSYGRFLSSTAAIYSIDSEFDYKMVSWLKHAAHSLLKFAPQAPFPSYIKTKCAVCSLAWLVDDKHESTSGSPRIELCSTSRILLAASLWS